jgi:hypothetical protein
MWRGCGVVSNFFFVPRILEFSDLICSTFMVHGFYVAHPLLGSAKDGAPFSAIFGFLGDEE